MAYKTAFNNTTTQKYTYKNSSAKNNDNHSNENKNNNNNNNNNRDNNHDMPFSRAIWVQGLGFRVYDGSEVGDSKQNSTLDLPRDPKPETLQS